MQIENKNNFTSTGEEFTLSENFIGKFAIVKLWPGLKAAEDECISRFKNAAKQIGLECIEIDSMGFRLDKKKYRINKADVDFVIHLHFDTPKNYDALSFVALWNPTDFFYQWGYERVVRNLLTHDDFLSCGSHEADNLIRRSIRDSCHHLEPKFRFYHSVGATLYPPSLGDKKLIYFGINWDALKGGVSRHQAVLQGLDDTGLLRIYGPSIFQGVKVWDGYKSYVRGVPFDGTSVIKEISRAGIALVLSSQAHKDAGLMSNRLFESIAAGAVVICDENSFARDNFGDCLLYVDGRAESDQIIQDILDHVDWIINNENSALNLIHKSQKLLNERFSLTKSLNDLYANLDSRKNELASIGLRGSNQPCKVLVNFLCPEFDIDIIKNHINSSKQDYSNVTIKFVIDARVTSDETTVIEELLNANSIIATLLKVNFYENYNEKTRKIRRPMGKILFDIINNPIEYDTLVVVAPNEKLFSNHVSVLVKSIIADPNISVAATAAIIPDEQGYNNQVHEIIDFNWINPDGPVGYGRFMFRKSHLLNQLETILPYLDGRSIAALIGKSDIYQLNPATITIDKFNTFPNDSVLKKRDEDMIIFDISPKLLEIKVGKMVKIDRAYKVDTKVDNYTIAKLIIKLFDKKWLITQYHMIKMHGLKARMNTLYKKLSQ